ncbi:cytochrome P450 [Panaeolus papilionaceus]|nr:cytochrome P450 [Panaeolus papilionaceus]
MLPIEPRLLISIALGILPVFGIAIGLYDVIMRWINPPSRKVLPYPPGPRIANHLPRDNNWLVYSDWAKKYGDIIHFKLRKEHHIVLHRAEDAIELLEKRSGIYSDRKLSATMELMGFAFNTTRKPYGDLWRQHRRILKKYFEKDAALSYIAIQQGKVHKLLQNLSNTPDNFCRHIKRTTTSIILAILYGDNLTDDVLDYFVDLAQTAVTAQDKAGVPGSSIIDSYPSLRNIPAWFPTWFPGVSSKRLAKEVKACTGRMLEEPMRLVGKELMHGTAGGSVVSELLENCYIEKEYNVIREVAATVYAGGSESIIAALETFFLAMAIHPEVQKNAQNELDRVIGRSRLPNLQDQCSLPYTIALYRELLRWRPPATLGVPHVATDNDVYRGYYIPKGSSITPNIWSMTRDEARYPDPEDLKPERYMNPDGTLNDDDLILAFGFGRRMCPGKDLAGNTIWLALVSVLSTFNISKKKGQADIVPSFIDGTVSHPQPFECAITIRDDKAAALVR